MIVYVPESCLKRYHKIIKVSSGIISFNMHFIRGIQMKIIGTQGNIKYEYSSLETFIFYFLCIQKKVKVGECT